MKEPTMDDARAAREIVANAVYGFPLTNWSALNERTREHYRTVADCVLRELEQAGYALARPAPAGEGLAAELEALLRDVIIAAGGVANPGCSIDFLRCAPAEVEALHAKWKALAKAPVSGDGFHLDRRAACRYYGYDDEKDLNYWGDRSKHNDVERLAEFLRRHRLGLTSDERENG